MWAFYSQRWESVLLALLGAFLRNPVSLEAVRTFDALGPPRLAVRALLERLIRLFLVAGLANLHAWNRLVSAYPQFSPGV